LSYPQDKNGVVNKKAMKANQGKAKGTQTDLAKLLNVSQQAVSKMVKAGVVRVEADGKILLEQAVEDWNTKVEAHQQRPMNGRGSATETIKEQAETYHKARARREVAEAALAELRLQRALGQVLDAEEAKKALTDVALATRDRILSVPRRVAPELVGIQDESVIVDKLYRELETALLSLSEKVF
jgi:phage terminase Nu1 subunit (DNA packaging protein)